MKCELNDNNDFTNIRWIPSEYSQADVIARSASEEMLSRLPLINIQPNWIVDVGAGLGKDAALLKTFYPAANVISIDQSQAMLALHSGINANAEQLPIKKHSIDILYSNLLLPWINPSVALKEWHQVLRPNGIVLLTTLGLDTLKELTPCLTDKIAVNLLDMHDLGDVLVQSGFSEPVVDVSYITLCYKDSKKMIKELQATGMLFDTPIDDSTLPLEITFEIIFAHAFVAETNTANDDGVTYVPLSRLRRQLKKS